MIISYDNSTWRGAKGVDTTVRPSQDAKPAHGALEQPSGAGTLHYVRVTFTFRCNRDFRFLFRSFRIYSPMTHIKNCCVFCIRLGWQSIRLVFVSVCLSFCLSVCLSGRVSFIVFRFVGCEYVAFAPSINITGRGFLQRAINPRPHT